MKVALVYDRVNKIGGAERVLTTLGKIWPDAPLYTSIYNKKTAPWADRFEVRPSFLQKLPFAKTRHEWLAFLATYAFESLNFDGFDVVVSVSSAEAKGIITPVSTMHINYCLTPTRYLWSGKAVYEKKGLKGLGLKILAKSLREWDFLASKRPDVMLAISRTVQKRIKKYYRRDSEIIYPPVSRLINNKNYPPSAIRHQPFYLLVSRLVSYKKVDLAIKAFSQMPERKLIIVGDGEEKNRLQSIAKKNISFIGQLTDDELVGYYQSCRAVIFPQEEDFGITALEAQALGKPVIAYSQGGASETVIHQKTGWLYNRQTTTSLRKAIQDFEKRKWPASACMRQAEKFSETKFIKKFKILVEDKWQKFRKNI